MSIIIIERSDHRVGDAFVLPDWAAVICHLKGYKYIDGCGYRQYDDGPILRKETWRNIELGITYYCREVEFRRS